MEKYKLQVSENKIKTKILACKEREINKDRNFHNKERLHIVSLVLL
jgi:hypothetical protein